MRRRARDPPRWGPPAPRNTASLPCFCLLSESPRQDFDIVNHLADLQLPFGLPVPSHDESTHLAQCFSPDWQDAERDSCGIRIATSQFLSPFDQRRIAWQIQR